MNTRIIQIKIWSNRLWKIWSLNSKITKKVTISSWTRSIICIIREIIANALDEQVLSNTKTIDIYKDKDTWHIRDYGRGIKYIHFTQNENDEKIRSDKLIGKFGVGLKDSLAVLFRHGCKVVIESKFNHVETKMALKSGFDIQTLHAEFKDATDDAMVGTDFAIQGISDKDMGDAKHRFLVFNQLTLLESTKYGEVYTCEKEQIPSVYINGVKVAEEMNFMFNYNITSMNAQIRKALNRDPEKGYIPTDKALEEAVEEMKDNEEYFWHLERLK